MVPRRAAGRAHPLLGHHARRPRAAAAPRATSRWSPRACASARSRARWRTRSTPSRRRCCRATAAASRSSSTIWETRNGSRARELNAPGGVYIETHGGTGVGGSDDHAGVDIGRTFTQTPVACRTGATFLDHVRAGQASRARRAGRRREVDARRDGASRVRSLGRGDVDRGTGPGGGLRDGPAAHARGRCAHRRDRHATSVPRTPAPCCARGWRASSSTERTRPARPPAVRRTSRTPSWTAAPAAATNARSPSRSRTRSTSAGCSTPASRPSLTRRRRPSSAARSASSPRRTSCASRS